MTTTRHERMSSVDTAWLRMDGPGNSMMIVGVGATSTPIRPADFRRMVEQRFLCFARFRCRVVADPLGASWVEDAALDLDAHLVEVALPEPAGKVELEALAGELAGKPLDPRRPMWQFHFVARYGGGSAWIMRVHHCYADGIAMVRVLLSMTEQDSGPAFAARPGAKPGAASGSGRPDVLPILGWVDQLARPAGDILEHVLAEGAKLLESGIHQLFHPQRAGVLAAQAGGMLGEFARTVTLPDDPDTPLRGTPSGRKAVAWGEPLPLHEVRTVAKALGCTINDVLMSAVAGALGAYLRGQDFETRGLRVRASVPVNLRAADEPLTLGNRFGLVSVDLALGPTHPLERLYAMRDTMAALKGSLQPPMSLVVLALIGLLPAALQTATIEALSRKSTIVVSNVPGPQAPLCLCGQRVTEMYFWVPQSGSLGLGVSLLSYAGQVHVGVISDRSLIESPAQVVRHLATEFEGLLLTATVGALAARQTGTQAKKARRRRMNEAQKRAAANSTSAALRTRSPAQRARGKG